MLSKRTTWISSLAIVLALSLFQAGCGGDAEEEATGEPPDTAATEVTEATETTEETEATETETAAGAEVTVLLSEYIVEPDPTSASAGDITFVADNQGGETHELVIVRGDDPSALPTDDDGAVDEDQIPEDDFIGEVEDVASGEQQETVLALESGSYVLFCNIVEEEDGEVESHFAEGMYNTFTVEG